MKGVDTVVRIIVEEFINQKWEFASAKMIAEKGPGWMTETYVLVRLKEAQKELRHRYPKLSTHLVTEHYIDTVPDMRQFYGRKVPPVTKKDTQAFIVAKVCLAIGQKGYGIRFVPNKDDYLCRAWEFFFLSGPACGLMRKRVRSTTQAVENKQIPAHQAMPILVKAALMVPQGINGPKNLPKDLKDIKKSAEVAFKEAWEKNFNRRQDGKWGRWGEPL